MSDSSYNDAPDVGPKRALAPDMPISPVFKDNNFVKDEPDPAPTPVGDFNLFPVHDDSAGNSDQTTPVSSSSSSSSRERPADRPDPADPVDADHPESDQPPNDEFLELREFWTNLNPNQPRPKPT